MFGVTTMQHEHAGGYPPVGDYPSESVGRDVVSAAISLDAVPPIPIAKPSRLPKPAGFGFVGVRPETDFHRFINRNHVIIVRWVGLVVKLINNTLANLLTALADNGLIINNTTA
jgi:hypothetical protein